MIKKLIAKWLGLYTEEEFHMTVQDRCRELRQKMNKERQENMEIIAQQAMDLFRYRNPLHYRLISVLPFISKRNIFYWVITQIPYRERDDCHKNCDIYAIDTSDNRAYLYFEITKTRAEIVDIVVLRWQRNQGVGSHLLATLEQLAPDLGVGEITGWLSPADADNRSIQAAFYKKNSYTIKLSPDEKNGSIKKSIPKKKDV